MPRIRFIRKSVGSAAVRRRSWTPSQIGASLFAWYDAEYSQSISFGTGGISRWTDRSGNGRHLDQTKQSAQPQYESNGLNGMPSVAFDGIDDCMYCDPSVRPWGGKLSPPFTVVCLFRPPPYVGFPTSSNRLYSSFNSNVPAVGDCLLFEYYIYGGGANPAAIAARADNFFAEDYRLYSSLGIPLHPSSAFLSVVTYDSAPSRRSFGAVAGPVGSNVTKGLYGVAIACQGDAGVSGSFSNTRVSEFMVISGPRDIATIEKVEGYLAWKWGLQGGLVAGHPFKSGPPRI